MLAVSMCLFSPMASIRGPSCRKFRKKVVKASVHKRLQFYLRSCYFLSVILLQMNSINWAAQNKLV